MNEFALDIEIEILTAQLADRDATIAEMREALDELHKTAEKALDGDIELPRKELNDAMNDLWSSLRKSSTILAKYPKP